MKDNLGRIHDVHDTAAEVETTCEAHHRNNTQKPSQNGEARWLMEHVPWIMGHSIPYRQFCAVAVDAHVNKHSAKHIGHIRLCHAMILVYR